MMATVGLLRQTELFEFLAIWAASAPAVDVRLPRPLAVGVENQRSRVTTSVNERVTRWAISHATASTSKSLVGSSADDQLVVAEQE